MDCSKTEVFLKEWDRMCKTAKLCSKCEISKFVKVGCRNFVCENSAKAIKIVQEWSDAHPIKTRLSVLKEQYPKLTYSADGMPCVCAGRLYGFDCLEPSKDDCLGCWNTPIKGE